MNKKLKFSIIIVGILLSFGYLIFSSIKATGIPYMKIPELKSMNQAGEVKVTGKVKKGTLDYDPHAPLIKFRAVGPDGKSVKVSYEGLKPDAMKEGGHVILEG
ncbi:MAG: cytochrome c maturation protein CcmE, partial [bacterium]